MTTKSLVRAHSAICFLVAFASPGFSSGTLSPAEMATLRGNNNVGAHCSHFDCGGTQQHLCFGGKDAGDACNNDPGSQECEGTRQRVEAVDRCSYDGTLNPPCTHGPIHQCGQLYDCRCEFEDEQNQSVCHTVLADWTYWWSCEPFEG